MNVADQVASIDNKKVSLKRSSAAYNGNKRNWSVGFRKAECYKPSVKKFQL